MRLQSIKLIGQFKCISGTEENPFFYAFSPTEEETYQPLVLVGLNGSGKSNLIELISDIFCFSERSFNKQYQLDCELTYKFELRYSLFKNNQRVRKGS
jgi:predicted ATPase